MKPHTEQRLQMHKRGWSPLPNIDKMCVYPDWPRVRITKKEIKRWDRMRKYTATGLRLDNGLCAIDFDINHEKVEELYAFVLSEFPELEGALYRTGKGYKQAWFCRVSEPFARIASPVFVDPGIADCEGFCLEVFGGGSPRQFGAMGWHTVDELEYSWGDLSPVDVALADLPELDKFDIFELVRVANAWLKENGFEIYSEDNAGETEPDHVYDLAKGLTFDTRTDGTLSLKQLRRLIEGHQGGHYYCSASFVAGPVAKNTRRCSASLDHDGGLAIWDSMTGLTHHEEAHAPRSREVDNDYIRQRFAEMGHDLEAERDGGGRVEENRGRFADYLYTADGDLRQNEANVAIRLDSDAWQGIFSRSEFDHGGWVLREMPGDTRGLKHPRRISDDDLAHTQRELQHEEFPNIPMTKVKAAITMVALDNPHHPIRDYLSALEWDGTERINHLAETYLGTAINGDRAYIEAVCRKWLISAVARVFQPGCKADHMLVLQGPQDQGKSTFFAVLGDPWFGDDMPPVGHKDAKEWVRDQWIAEIAELSALSGKDVEHVKAFLTTSTDKYRKAYGSVVENVPRQVVFGGTTNDDEYLMDTTGGRRFWPVKARRIDIEALKRDRDQLWAEAVVAYAAGERWYLDKDMDVDAVLGAKDAQESTRSAYLEEEPIRKWLRRQKAADGVLAYDVATGALRMDVTQIKGTGTMRHTIPRIMSLLGWEKAKRTEMGFRWVRGPNAEPYRVIDRPKTTTAAKAAAREITVVEGDGGD